MIIDAAGRDHRSLNEEIRKGDSDITINGCLGQRFIASGMDNVRILINGTPGNALGAYLDGADILVRGNAQDAAGDTMNEGRIVIYGNVGDAAGYAMRGGEIYIRGDAGYRAGIHMKAYSGKLPVMVVGGSCGSFLGEYQAGGMIIVLGLDKERPVVGNFCGTGMHGGRIYLRGDIEGLKLPKQVSCKKAGSDEMEVIEKYLVEFSQLFDVPYEKIADKEFHVLTPDTHNPYKQLYVQN
ncbi:MAG: glutamate synthase [Clostridiaceae bacterium]|nr:glutamate synthase [Clostridiaceae bacterium]